MCGCVWPTDEPPVPNEKSPASGSAPYLHAGPYRCSTAGRATGCVIIAQRRWPIALTGSILPRVDWWNTEHNEQLGQNHGCRPPHTLVTQLEVRHVERLTMAPPHPAPWARRIKELADRDLEDASNLIRLCPERGALARHADHRVEGKIAHGDVQGGEETEHAHIARFDADFFTRLPEGRLRQGLASVRLCRPGTTPGRRAEVAHRPAR